MVFGSIVTVLQKKCFFEQENVTKFMRNINSDPNCF